MVWIAVTAAFVSAAFLALGTQRQAAAVRNAHGREVSGKQIVQMLKNRTWLFGLVLMITGVILNIVALSLAPLTVVQPLGAVALVLTTIITRGTARYASTAQRGGPSRCAPSARSASCSSRSRRPTKPS
ncbi:DMT family transporter [Pseudoglutamicibacter cumminsii]|uniref:CNNM transmembrane domain-containing protein n=1 Tax=Pseudoglutamicibacter cumminsii TaxID=156979 RepID=A0ABX5L8J7_9MICC|nr:DMT family transporter [Pseudoglutamicibacter cumminsii]PWI27618.1 hypothetical protein CAY35_06440 [Pseudoglutamicibacter cumminsii]